MIKQFNHFYYLLVSNKFVRILGFLLVPVLLFIWFYSTNEYAVNIPFYDLWDLYDPPLNELSLIEIFSKQHGPHRQGIGFLLTAFIDYLSGMNVRAISFTITSLIILSSGCYFLVKRRFFGHVSVMDVSIFLITLAPSQLFMHTPNISHGAMPALLLSLYCASFLVRNYALRSALILLINFNMIFSAFGIFIGLITPLVFAGEMIYFIKTRTHRKLLLAVCSFLLALFSLYLFSIDYTFAPAAPNFVFPHSRPMEYLDFMAIAYASFLGSIQINMWSYFIGFSSLLVLLAVLFKHLLLIIKNYFSTDNRQLIMSKLIVILIAYSLIFIFNTAIGRVSLGLEAAQSSRYMPYLVSSVLALYFHICTINNLYKPLSKTFFFVVLLFSLSLGNKNFDRMKRYADYKETWKNNYLKYEDIQKANALTNFSIHPQPGYTALKDKLDYLKQHRLSLFKQYTRTEAPVLHSIYNLDLSTMKMDESYNNIKSINQVDEHLELHCSNDPHFDLPHLPEFKEGYLEVKIDISSPHFTMVKLFYAAKGDRYHEENSRAHGIYPGRHTLTIYITPDEPIENIRFDPGEEEGTYLLHSFEIWQEAH